MPEMVQTSVTGFVVCFVSVSVCVCALRRREGKRTASL